MCIASMKTQTAALRGRKALEKYGIASTIVSLDASLTKNGCAYGLSFSCYEAGDAERILRDRGIGYGEIMGKGADFDQLS